jgi:hypothetical protein
VPHSGSMAAWCERSCDRCTLIFGAFIHELLRCDQRAADQTSNPLKRDEPLATGGHFNQ